MNLSGLVNTLNNEGEMDQMLKAQTELDFTSVLVPSLTWDPMTNKGTDFHLLSYTTIMPFSAFGRP